MDAVTQAGPAILFYLFAGLALASALLVVSLRNPMYSAMALLLSFLSVAGLFVLRHAEFLAAVQIFVYGGGVMVLFLFVIMLVNLHQLKEERRFLPQAPYAGGLVVLLVAVFVFLLADTGLGVSERVVAELSGGNTEAVAMVLYRQFVVPFEVASIFLLVAMIGAVVLGRRE